MISAILLAAGKSERMGRFKQLLPLGGKTFVECCVDNLLGSGLDEVIVVTGHQEEAIRLALAGRPVRVVYNSDYELGMATSIRCGFRHLAPSSTAAMLALVDQPLIPSSIIEHLVRVYEGTDPLILIPRYDGRRGHPTIISRKLADEVEGMDLTVGLKGVLSNHAADIKYLDVETEAILLDFDYPEDYKRLLTKG